MRTSELNLSEARQLRYSARAEEECETTGLFGSVRKILAVALTVFESRIELITVELRELKGRALGLIFWGVAMAFLGFMTLVAIMATVVFLLWSSAVAVMAGFSGFFVVLAVGSFMAARAKLKQIPFGETVAQLKKDRELVRDELS